MKKALKSQALANSAIKGLSELSPLVITVITFVSFLLLGIIEYNYYQVHILTGNIESWGLMIFIAGGGAAFIQLARCGFVLMSIRDFSNDHDGRGIVGLLFSLGTTIYCGFEISDIAAAWTSSIPKAESWTFLFLQFINWGGFALEVRLALSVSADDPAIDEEAYPTPSSEQISLKDWYKSEEAKRYSKLEKLHDDLPSPSPNGANMSIDNADTRTIIRGFASAGAQGIQTHTIPHVATGKELIATENLEGLIEDVQDKYKKAWLKYQVSVLKAYQNNLRTKNGRPETVKAKINQILLEINEELSKLKQEAPLA